MDLLNYINENLYIIIPALWVIGSVIKSLKHIRDDYIPGILILLGIIFATLLGGFTGSNIIQGILIGGAAVGLHQAQHQLNK